MLTALSGILYGQGRQETEYVLKEEVVRGGFQGQTGRQTDRGALV